MASRHEPTDDDMAYARAAAARLAGDDRVYMAKMAANLTAANLLAVDGDNSELDDFRIRRARAFGRIWDEHGQP